MINQRRALGGLGESPPGDHKMALLSYTNTYNDIYVYIYIYI